MSKYQQITIAVLGLLLCLGVKPVVAKSLTPFIDIPNLEINFKNKNIFLINSILNTKKDVVFVVGFNKWILKDKFLFTLDYNGNNNNGIGFCWFFSRLINLSVGPVFPEKKTYGDKDWGWISQLLITF